MHVQRSHSFYLAFFLLTLLSKTSFALPVSVNDCIASGDCFYASGPSSSFSFSIDGNLISAHRLFDISGGSPIEKVIMEYQLGSSSYNETEAYDYENNQLLPVERNAIGGTLWLEVNSQYELSNPLHDITLYFEDTSNSTAIDFWSGYGAVSNEQHLSITTNGLLAGSGETYVQCCEEAGLFVPSPFNSSAETNPSLFDSNGNLPVICVADGCDAGAMLNLIGLDYVETGDIAQLVFNSDESRSLLYYTTAGYEGYSSNTYAMSDVPVPASLWLFASGMTTLLAASRLRSKQVNKNYD